MQFMRCLIVLLPILPEVVNLMDSQGAGIEEELAAFDINEADPVEFGPARLLVCCTVRFGSGWNGIPSRIRGVIGSGR
jgi:hypothetical protein